LILESRKGGSRDTEDRNRKREVRETDKEIEWRGREDWSRDLGSDSKEDLEDTFVCASKKTNDT
jgi:hypothetical protein